MRMLVTGMRRMRVDLRRRHTGVQRGAHVAQVRGQKQIGVQRFEVAPGRLTAVESAALNIQPVMLRRAKHAHARDRVIAREDHHLDALRRLAIGRRLPRALWRVIESQQFFDQRKRHARFSRHIESI